MKFSKIILIAVIAIWAVAVGTGTVWVTDYASRPGRSADSPKNLPSEILDRQSDYLPKLLIFLHPYCPCSRATLAELARLNARNRNLAETRVYFYQPDDQPDDWARTELWRQASAIPNVTIQTVSEEDLREFGVTTSGQTLLYNAYGQLLFSGGITATRGHEGDNAGSESIENYLRTGKTTVSQTPVFGCILIASE